MIFSKHVVNISLDIYFKDKEIDRLFHALGRPLHPMKEHFRNRFVVDRRTHLAEEMKKSADWKLVQDDKGKSKMVHFEATEQGKKRVAKAVAARRVPEKIFHSTYLAQPISVVAPDLETAKSRTRLALLSGGYETKGSVTGAIAEMSFTQVQ